MTTSTAGTPVCATARASARCGAGSRADARSVADRVQVTTEDDDEEEDVVLRPPVVLKVATDAEAKACEAALQALPSQRAVADIIKTIILATAPLKRRISYLIIASESESTFLKF